MIGGVDRTIGAVLLLAALLPALPSGAQVEPEEQSDQQSDNPRLDGRMKKQTKAEEKLVGSRKPTGDKPMFTSDWVSEKTDGWLDHLGHLAGKEGARGLEIGSFEGRSAIWFVENVLTGEDARMTCVDVFGERLDEFFDHNVRVTGVAPKIDKVKGMSQQALRGFPAKETFDFIYVDGCHLANCALADMVLGWDLLKTGGIMIVDDYDWPGPALDRPRMAVDAFLEIYAPKLEVVEQDYQVVVRKTGPGY